MLKENEREKDLSKEIMQQIDDENIQMKPRVYFVLGSLFLSIGLIGLIGLTIFFVNLVIFRLRIHAPFGFLSFGSLGMSAFLKTFPWIFFILTFFSLGGGVYLFRKYDFSHKQDLLRIALISFIVILSLGLFADFVGVNERVGRIKPMQKIYQEKYVNDNWLVGQVSKINNNDYMIVTPFREEIKVNLTEQTIFRLGKSIGVGDSVKVIGEWKDKVFYAKGIGRVDMKWRRSFMGKKDF